MEAVYNMTHDILKRIHAESASEIINEVRSGVDGLNGLRTLTPFEVYSVLVIVNSRYAFSQTSCAAVISILKELLADMRAVHLCAAISGQIHVAPQPMPVAPQHVAPQPIATQHVAPQPVATNTLPVSAAHEVEIEHLTAQIEYLDKKAQKYRKQVKTINAEHNAFIVELEVAHQAKRDELTALLDAAQKRITELEHVVQTHEDDDNYSYKLRQECYNAKARITALETELADARQTSAQQLAEIKTNYDSLDQKLTSVWCDRDYIRGEYNELNDKHESMKKLLDETQVELNETIDWCNGLETDLENAHGHVREANVRVANLECQRIKFMDDLNDAHVKYTALEAKYNDLANARGTIVGAIYGNVDKISTADEIAAERDSYKNRYEVASGMLAGITAQLIKMTNERDQFGAQLAAYTAQ